MTKILFVCLGNICRSPMAEFVFKSIVKNIGKQEEFCIDSAATSSEEIGNEMHYGTISKLKEKGIEYTNHKARRITPNDYNDYDYIIGMESNNVRNIIKIIGNDKEGKVYRLLDFSDNPRDIADPYYTGDFNATYNDILEGCKALIKKLIK